MGIEGDPQVLWNEASGEHEVPRQHKGLGCVPSAFINSDSRWSTFIPGNSGDGIDEPGEDTESGCA